MFTRTEHEVLLQRAGALAFAMYVKRPWHWNAGWTFLPLVVPALLAVPGAILAFSRWRSAARRRLGLLVAFVGAALAFGVYLELEHFADNYYPRGATLALFAWRLLLNVGWLAALSTLWVVWSDRRDVVSFRSIGASAASLLVGLFALGALICRCAAPLLASGRQPFGSMSGSTNAGTDPTTIPSRVQRVAQWLSCHAPGVLLPVVGSTNSYDDLRRLLVGPSCGTHAAHITLLHPRNAYWLPSELRRNPGIDFDSAAERGET